MNSALNLTWDILASTPNGAADNLMSLAIAEDVAIRRQGIAAILRRKSRSGAGKVLRMWGELTDDELRVVQDYPSVMLPVLEETLKGPMTSPEWPWALDAIRMLSLGTLLPLVIERLDACSDDRLRNRMLATLLELGATLGDAARHGRDQPSIRGPVLGRLCESARQTDARENPRLLEAFLVVSNWSDRELRIVLQEDDQAAAAMADPLEHSRMPGVVQLVAGFIRRRQIPAVVRRTIELRADAAFRDSLFAAIGDHPTRVILRNLRQLRPLRVLDDWTTLVGRTPAKWHAGLLYAQTANSQDSIAQLTVILDVISRGSRRLDLAVVSSLSHCEPFAEETLMRAAVEVTNTDLSAIAKNPVAQLLWRTIQLLDHSDAAVVAGLRGVLKPLHVGGFLRHIDSLPETNYQRLGGMVRLIDPNLTTVISDELRCPVMDRRLRAIKVARVCDVVPEVETLLIHAAIHDHREARLAAIETLGCGTSPESVDVLNQIADGPDGALRDRALQALSRRLRVDQESR
jgi:hypothetical protein